MCFDSLCKFSVSDSAQVNNALSNVSFYCQAKILILKLFKSRDTKYFRSVNCLKHQLAYFKCCFVKDKDISIKIQKKFILLHRHFNSESCNYKTVHCQCKTRFFKYVKYFYKVANNFGKVTSVKKKSVWNAGKNEQISILASNI